MDKTKFRLNFLPIFIATLTLFALFFVYLPFQPVDEFCFTNINAAELIINGRTPGELSVSGFFVLHLIEFYHRFYPHMIFAVLSTVSGVKPDALIFWPIPIFLAFLSLWLILKTINTSVLNRTIFTLLFASTLSMNFFFESYYISFAFSLFFLFAYLILKHQNNESLITIILWILLFLAITFSHYTAAVSAIILMFLCRLRTKRLWLVIVFIVTFISLEVIIYTQTAVQIALFNAVRTPPQQILFDIQTYLKNLILATSQPSTYAVINPYFNNSIIQITGSLNRLVLITYLFLSFAIIYKSKNLITIKKDTRFWFILSLFVAGIFEVLIYLFIGFGGILQRILSIALFIFMSYLWPPILTKNSRNKSTICKILAGITIALAICLPILNFMRSYTFSLEYGADYNHFYQRTNEPILFFLLHKVSLVYTDHYTCAILTYKAVHMDIKQNLQTIILTDELAEINTGYFILPYVKALRVGWRGYILSSNFHSMFIQRNIIYNSRFFLCGY